MGHFYTWNISRQKHLFIIIIAAFFTALLLWANSQNFTTASTTTQENKAIIGVKTNTKDIALTFNLEWGDSVIYDILPILNKENIRGTFFINGKWAEGHKGIVGDIVEGGHEIGILGYHYEPYTNRHINWVKQDLKTAKQTFNNLNYKNLKYTRAPYGDLNQSIINTIYKEELIPIHWSISAHDQKASDARQIIKQVTSKTSNGDIILYHASDSAAYTAKALEKTIPILKNKGFHFKTTSELVNQVEVNPRPIN